MSGAIKRKTGNGGARHELDKFYTKDEVALDAIHSISSLIAGASTVIEPSAGGGSFSRQIKHPNLLAFDLEPESDQIIKQDWFDTKPSQITGEKLLVIGNPPFGVRSDLAKKFIAKAVKLNADTIAFILPKTFSKALNQRTSLFPASYRLVIEKELPDNSFLLEGKDFHIPCGWYVWTKDSSFLPEVSLRKTLLTDSHDFSFLPRGSVDADFTLNGNNGRVKDVTGVTNPKAEHYIRVTDRNKVEEIREIFCKLPLDFKSSVNGGVAWVGKQEILAAYNQVNS